VLGQVGQLRGDLAEAERRFRAADAIYRAGGRSHMHAQIVHLLGDLARARCEHALALELFEESAHLKDVLGRRTDAAVSRITGCLAAIQAGRLDTARATISAGIRELDLTGAEGRAAHASVYLAKVDAAEGEYDKARELLESLLPVLERLHQLYGRLDAHLELGHVLIALGRGEEAHRHLLQAQAVAAAGLDSDGVALAAAFDVKREALTGSPRRARALLPEVLRLLAGPVTPGCRAEALMHLAQCTVYDPEAASEWSGLEPLMGGVHADLQGRAAALLLQATRAVRGVAGGTGALLGAAEELKSALPGIARAEVTLLALWLEAAGRLHRGEESAARELRATVRERAQRMSHAALARLAS
jgi:tetratricopeptide (TPR) repeat protein